MGHHTHASNSEERLEELKKSRSKLKLVLILTLSFAVIEVIGGIVSNSLALLSDAGHMVVDSGAIILSLFAVHLSMKPSTADNTYSLARMEIVAAFINGISLVLFSGFIFYEAFERILEPVEIKGGLMLTIAFIGMIVNIIAGAILWSSSHGNLNVKGAFLHVLGDLAGSVGAVLAGAIVIKTGWTYADPIISFLIAGLIIYTSIGLIKDSLHILLEGTPRHLNTDEIIAKIKSVEGVIDVHDFHIWSLTTGMPLLTAHLKIESCGTERDSDDEADGCHPCEWGGRILSNVSKMLEDDYSLTHTTIQMEDKESGCCHVGC